MVTMLLLAALPSAHAWEHMGKAWAEEDFPLKWKMNATEEDSLDPGYSLEVLQTAWDNWLEAECAQIGNEYDGVEVIDGRNDQDGRISIFWEDPDDETEVGVLGVTYPRSTSEIVKETSTLIYRRMYDADIVFNDNVDFGSDAQIESDCGGQYSIEGVATHEIGHLHGLDHSCEDGDPCTETDKKEATMFWSVAACNTAQSDINVDDEEGITSLYGPYGYFDAVSDRLGGTPLDVAFEVFSDTTVIGVNWNFGDGETSTEINPVHTYTSRGQYTVQAEIQLEDPTCGVSTYRYDELGFVTACEPPAPAEGADGLFSLQHEDGLRWSTINHTDVTVYGCIDTVVWQVYKGDGEGAIKPENLVDLDGDGEGDSLGAWSPDITFPAEGTYTVVANIGGPGGLEGAFLTVNVEDKAAEGGCDTSGAGAGFGLGGLLVAAAAGLRRRRA